MSAPEEEAARRRLEDARRVLGVSVGATRAELKERFYREAKRVHPDVLSAENGDGLWEGAGVGGDANAAFRRVREAYERLCAEDQAARDAAPPRGKSWRRTPGALRAQPVGSMVGMTGLALAVFAMALALNEASKKTVITAFRSRYGRVDEKSPR